MGITDDLIRDNQDFIADYIREQQANQAALPPVNGSDSPRNRAPPPPPPPPVAPPSRTGSESPVTAPKGRGAPPAPPPARRTAPAPKPEPVIRQPTPPRDPSPPRGPPVCPSKELFLFIDLANVINSHLNLPLHRRLKELGNLLILMTNSLHDRTPHLFRIKDRRLRPGLQNLRQKTTNQENLAQDMACPPPFWEHELQHLHRPLKGVKYHHLLQLERFSLHSRLALTLYPPHLRSTRHLCRLRLPVRLQRPLPHHHPAPLVLYLLLRQEKLHHLLPQGTAHLRHPRYHRLLHQLSPRSVAGRHLLRLLRLVV
jgi:hypothetical protein